MTVYAPTPAFVESRRHPRALTAIILVHAALIGAVMSVKMDLPAKFKQTITRIELIDPPKPPPEPQPQPKQQPAPREAVVDRVPTVIPIPMPDPVPLDRVPTPLPIPDFGELPGNSLVPDPQPRPAPKADPVRAGPRFATAADDVRPPYPDDKRRLDEEAALKLRLSIDARGRVVAVEPVGRADRSFLEAARRHIIARWRYKPATEDGRAVASTTVITLRFELED